MDRGTCDKIELQVLGRDVLAICCSDREALVSSVERIMRMSSRMLELYELVDRAKWLYIVL